MALVTMESKLFCDFVGLMRHCALLRYESGELREPGWFQVKTWRDVWQIRVSEPTAALSFTASATTFDDAFLTAELLLTSERPPWRPDEFLARRNSGNSKKRT